MKARIQAETARDDLSEAAATNLDSAIAMEIDSAIKFYRSHRFWFTERRTRCTFNTVIGQSEYTATDQADIPNLIRIDSITTDPNNQQAYAMKLTMPEEMEIWLSSNSALSSTPYRYSYYEQKLRFYPIPDKVMPVRIMGVFRVVAPVDDAEEDNPWMNDAEELIRARAKRNVYMNWMLGTEPALLATMKAYEDEALERLRIESSSRNQVSRFRYASV